MRTADNRAVSRTAHFIGAAFGTDGIIRYIGCAPRAVGPFAENRRPTGSRLSCSAGRPLHRCRREAAVATTRFGGFCICGITLCLGRKDLRAEPWGVWRWEQVKSPEPDPGWAANAGRLDPSRADTQIVGGHSNAAFHRYCQT